MLRPLLSILLLFTLSANAQLLDTLRSYLGAAVAGQQPLDATARVADLNSRVITSANWLENVNTTSALATEDDVDEWIFYFTSTANLTNGRNISMWDDIYKEAVYKISTTRPATRLHFGRIDYASAEARELCDSFMLTDQGIPAFYHLASYPHNGTVEIRSVQWDRNTTTAEKPEFLKKYHTEGLWRQTKPWTGIFNPIDGRAKAAAPYLRTALSFYEMVPQWLLMIVISIVGRQLTTKAATRMVGNREAPAAPPAS